MANKYPAFWFYPHDWMSDPNLRRCSPAARGVWIDMICMMYDCERPGVLATNGVPWPIDEIATAIGTGHQNVAASIHELLDKGVARQDDSGAVYSRRVMRDVQIRNERALAGAKGGTISKRKAKRKQRLKQIPEDETEVEDETESEVWKTVSRNLGKGSALRTKAFARAWVKWDRHRREIRKTLTRTTIELQIRKLEKWGHDRAIAAIEYTIEKGWTGLFEPSSDATRAVGQGKNAARVREGAERYANRGQVIEQDVGRRSGA